MRLRQALGSYKIAVAGCERLDPRAEDILYTTRYDAGIETLAPNPYCEQLENAMMARLSMSAPDFEVLGHGIGALVLRAGEAALRVSEGGIHPRLREDELIIPSQGSANCGRYSFEILELADTKDITDRDVEEMKAKAAGLGYIFADAGKDQLGLCKDGKKRILDPGALKKATPAMNWKNRN